MGAAIVTTGLKKVYPNGRGLLGMDLAIGEGEIFGFLGPNGAGKTTTIRTLLGLLHASGGTARIQGHDVVRDSLAVRRVTGYLPGEPALYDDLTGRQHLDLALALRGVAESAVGRDVAENLEVDLDRRVHQLSRGNRQKVAILLAMAHDPAVLILDEPTTGLDPLAQDTFRAILRREQARGKTVFFSSHILPEVEAISDRVGIIRDGRLVAVDSVTALRRTRLKEVTLRFRAAPPDLAGLPGVADLQVDGGRVRFHLRGDLAPLFALLADRPPVDATIVDPSLEEVFRSYYGGDAA